VVVLRDGEVVWTAVASALGHSVQEPYTRSMQRADEPPRVPA